MPLTLRPITGTLYDYTTGDPLPHAPISWRLLTRIATVGGDIAPPASYQITTDENGAIPAGFGLLTPETDAWRYEVKIPDARPMRFYLQREGNAPLTIAQVLALAGNEGTEAVPDTPVSPHAASHASGGSDPLAPADIGAEAEGAAATVQDNLNALSDIITAVVNGSYEVDGLAGSVFNLTLTANSTISFANMTGRVVTLNLIQDGMGSRLVTWTAVAWGVTGEPVLSTGAGERDKITFENNGLTTDGHYIEAYEA